MSGRMSRNKGKAGERELSDSERHELKFLHTKGTCFSYLAALSLFKKGMVTIKHRFSNSPYNGYEVDLTEYGRGVADTLITEGQGE